MGACSASVLTVMRQKIEPVRAICNTYLQPCVANKHAVPKMKAKPDLSCPLLSKLHAGNTLGSFFHIMVICTAPDVCLDC